MKLRRLSVASLLVACAFYATPRAAHASPTAPAAAAAAPVKEKPTAFHTDVIFLDVVQAARGVSLYERVIGLVPGARVAVGKDPKSMVAHDSPERLARFRVLVPLLVRGEGGKERLFVRPVAHMLPSDLARMLLDVMNPNARQTMLLVPDDRSGKLVVRASIAVYKKLDLLIRRVDIPSRTRQSTRVIPAPAAP
jgi:hypothetical protein